MYEIRPISEAPTDGSDILVWQPYTGRYGIGLTRKDTRAGVWRTANWCKKAKAFRSNIHSFVELSPTYWTHLPEDPE